MNKIVCTHYWVCSFCYLPLYNKDEMIKHLLDTHKIDVGSPLADVNMIGDNLVVSDLIIPKVLQGENNEG